MYKLVPYKKSTVFPVCDYVFKTFEAFYKIADLLTVPLTGRYVICVITDKQDEITEFVKKQNLYEHLIVNIYAPATLINYMVMYNNRLKVDDKESPFDTFQELISKYNLLLEKNLISLFYASIEHDFSSMESAVRLTVNEFGKNTVVTEKMLGSLFILNKTVYPRQVLLSYLRCDRWRASKLKKCVESVGEQVAFYACRKNIKDIFDAKINYFKTGQATDLIKSLNTERVLLMYRILVVEPCSFKNLTISLNLYERGISQNDII